MTKSYLIILIIAVTSINSNSQEKGSPVIYNFLSKDYNGEPQNWDIVFDQRGVMYVANNSGILEYDGVEWRIIKFPSDFVRSLAINKKNEIFAGGSGEFGFLKADLTGMLQYISLSQNLDSIYKDFNDVWKIIVHHEMVYFLTKKYIFVLDNGKLNQLKSKKEFFDMFEYKDKLYIVDLGYGLSEVSGNKMISNNSYFIDEKLRGIFETDDKSKEILAYYYNGLENFNLSLGIKLKSDEFADINRLVSNNKLLYRLKQFDDSLFYACTIYSGFVIFDKKGKIRLHLTKDNSNLEDNLLFNVNKRNQLWVVTNTGISRIEYNSPFETWSEKNGLLGEVYDQIRYKDTLYLTTSTGIFYFDNNELKEISNLPLQGWQFLELSVIGGSKRLLLGHNSGIYEIKNKRIWSETKPPYCFRLIQSKNKDSEFYIAHLDSICLYTYKDKEIKYKKTIGHVSYANIMIGMPNGDIWISSYSGKVYRIRNYKMTEYKLPGHIEKAQASVFVDKGNVLFSSEKALYKFDDKSDKIFRIKDYFKKGLKDVYIRELVNDKDGNLWAISSTGGRENVSIEIRSETDKQIKETAIKKLSKYSVSKVFFDNKNIWLATDHGLFKYNEDKELDYYSDFRTLIRKVTLNNDSVIYWGAGDSQDYKYPQIKYKNNNISFEFACTFFEEEKENQYSYYLNGNDKEWSIWTKAVKKEYTNLSPGDYLLQVKSRNIYGKESDIATYSFTILAPWFRTTFAYFMYLLFLIGFVWLLIRIRTRQMRHEKVKLTELIHERTKHIENQKEEIQSQADKLCDVYNTLLEVTKFKDGMTSMIVHDLKNPLNFIMNISKNLEPEIQLLSIRQSSRHMLNLVMNILDVNKYQKTKMDLELKDVPLFKIISKATDYISFLASQKNISIKMNIVENPNINVDQEIILRVFTNLLTNAIKYTPLNGTITIDSNRDSSQNLNIQVIDAGPGIPKDKEELVFSEFGQIMAKKSGEVHSTGLGLTFCKIAVEAHGGKIGFESNLNGGTTFWFTIPSESIKNALESFKVSHNLIIEPQINNLLNKEDIEYLSQFIDLFKATEIYSISKLKMHINQIENKSEGIKLWKEKLLDASYAGNEKLYIDLINLGI